MAVLDRAALKVFFETGDEPTEAQFADLIDSLFSLVDPNTIESDTLFDGDLITEIDKVIKASSGGSQIDLRAFGVDSGIFISPDNGAGLLGWIRVGPLGSSMGFGDFTTPANHKGDFRATNTDASMLFGNNKIVEVRDNELALFGVAPIARPDVTGSRGGNAALASLLTALDSLGAITDSTTA